MRACAYAGLSAFLMIMAGGDRITAQEATPAAAIEVAPAACASDPIDTDHAAALMATPVASPELPLSDAGVVALPEGSPADDQTIAAVESVVSQLWSCNNARDKARVFGLFTDEAIQETVGFTEGSSWDTAELRAEVAAVLTPGEPRTQEEWASVDEIVSVTTLADGQVGVLILNSDPFVMDGDQVLDYFQFVSVDGEYKVSAVVLDPFDMTAGYGFEKSS